MARPEHIDDVLDPDDRAKEVASFDLKAMGLHPALVKAYAAFIEAAQKHPGVNVEEGYYGLKVTVGKTEAQLAEVLRDKQRVWDEEHRQYTRLMADDPLDELTDYERRTALRHAEAEGLSILPDYDVAVA